MTEDQESSAGGGERRPPFDLNLAVVLAGFAFEAYTSPPTDMGWRETDAAQCQTAILSNSFLREVYDGQLYIKLLKGADLPALDPWGTSDPYVIFQLKGQVAKSNVKWGTTNPTWNEGFTLNIKLATTTKLLVNAWDANVVTPHKRMGNGWVDLESLCDAFQAIYMRLWLNWRVLVVVARSIWRSNIRVMMKLVKKNSGEYPLSLIFF